ncbi:MAG: FadR family transcriptional regulator [Phycicoccus sp.]|nr:FadR family transcriptional regulator [Phycicoccus sp.]
MPALEADTAEFDGADVVGLTTITSRVLFGGAIQLSRPDLVAQRLAEAISVGILLDGERLPSEARLAEELGTGTATLRQALAQLRAQGLVETRRGRGGGTFVRTDARARAGTLVDQANAANLAHAHLLGQRLDGFSILALTELGDLRQAISGTAAALAADRALPDDLRLLHHRLDVLAAAVGTSAQRRADTQFAIAVAASAQSSILAERELSLRAELGDLLWWQVSEEQQAVGLAERRTLVKAIERRRADQARAICVRIITHDTERLVALRLEHYGADT